MELSLIILIQTNDMDIITQGNGSLISLTVVHSGLSTAQSNTLLEVCFIVCFASFLNKIFFNFQ